ncbi:MAG: hypothetical protein AAFQ82_08860 [Myxococcota bacterium]
MARRKRKAKKLERDDTELRESANPLAKIDDGLTQNLKRPSNDLIHESIMRGGGEPFGEPFSPGTSTLTSKIVSFFKQRGFFGFETFEKTHKKRNKFTRYGSSRFRGAYRVKRRP